MIGINVCFDFYVIVIGLKGNLELEVNYLIRWCVDKYILII